MPRTAGAAGSWLTDTQEQPRADALSGSRIRRRARFYRVYLLSAAPLCPLLLLALAAAVSGSSSTGTAATPERGWPGRAAATQTVLDWLSGPNPGLPEGRLLQWSGARSIETPATENAETTGNAALSVEIDAFVVVDGAGNRFTAEVQVAVDGQNRSRVLSSPSLTPLPVLDPDAFRGAGPWPSHAGPATETVSAAVRAWAAAYTSGDPAALRLTVGDLDRGHTYLPLTGLATATTIVGPSAALDPVTTVVRVDLNLDWATAAPPTQEPVADSPDTLRPPVTFDVLVTGADTAAPRVVAWGGPVPGPTLVPYGNAVPADTTPAQATEVVTWEPPAASHGPAG